MEIFVSDGIEKSSYIAYLYNSLMGAVTALRGEGELIFGGDRAVFRISVPGREEAFRGCLSDKIAEVIAIGYKADFLKDSLSVCLSAREKQLLCAALIAADFEGDRVFIRRRLAACAEYSVDGLYAFRLGALREKWEKIAACIPNAFASRDLKKFCDFLVGESRKKIYVKGNAVFGENFAPLRRSRLMGEENTETEIMLADAGFVYCLGGVEDSVGDFLQKYYAERAVFS